MSTYGLPAVAASLSWWGQGPVLGVVAGVVVVLAIVGVSAALVARRVRRSLQAQLAIERERHDALRLQVAALEALDLAARRLTGAQSPTAIADEVARAADELVGATEAILLIRAADDLTVTVRGSRGGQRGLAASASAPAQTLATQAVARRGPVRSDGGGDGDGHGEGHGDGDDGGAGVPADSRVPRLACPLRRADEFTGVVVLARGQGERPFSPADTTLVERLAAHVALAVARLQRREDADDGAGAPGHAARSGVLDLDARSAVVSDPVGWPVAGAPPASSQDDTAVNGAAPASPTPAPADGAAPASPTPAPSSIIDLAAVVRELTSHARILAQAQGERRRVAVLGPAQASSELPEETVQELIRTTYGLVIGGTEPGSNIAVEILALEDGWEIVVAHAGDALSTRSAAASSLLGLVAALDGEVESGQGAGVARIRIRLPHARTQEGRRAGEAGRSLAAR